MLNCHRERLRKLTFRALALRQSEIFHGGNSTFINSFDKTKLLNCLFYLIFLIETSEFCNFFAEFFKFFKHFFLFY